MICPDCTLPFASEYHVRCRVCRVKSRIVYAEKVLSDAKRDLVNAIAERERAQHTHRLYRNKKYAAAGDRA